MLKRAAVATAVAVLALAPARGETREPQEEGLQITISCKPPSFKIRRPLLVLNGTCPLSDGVIVKVNLSRVTESTAGTELLPMFQGAGGGTSEIEGKKFLYDAPIDGPGKFDVQVALIDDLQERHLAAEIKKKAGSKRNWQFEFLVWGDDLVPQLSPKLTELLALIKETLELVKRFETASGSEQGWAAESKPLVAEGTKFQGKLEHHELKVYYPAAVNNLFFTMRNVVNNAPYYTFSGGKFSGARDYHADGEKVKTFRGEEFNWDNLKRYIQETNGVGGREFCLWIVKDLRRTAGQMRGDIQDALHSQKSAVGVDVFQERLAKATFSDLDGLEAEIRGAKK